MTLGTTSYTNANFLRVAKMPDGTPEVYQAVQGEGISTGKPMVIVRLALCTLKCSFCDSKYTHQFEGGNRNFEAYVVKMSIPELGDLIEKTRGNHKNVMLTGGEPLFQQVTLILLMDYLNNTYGKGWNFEIETNGTIVPVKPFWKRVGLITCSPKLASSGNTEANRDIPEAITALLKVKKPVWFKFVISNSWAQDLQEIKDWQDKYRVPNNRIYLMPEGIEPKEVITNGKIVNELAIRHGYLASSRIQVLIYGNRRAI
jgi:organic radical activating enzyme